MNKDQGLSSKDAGLLLLQKKKKNLRQGSLIKNRSLGFFVLFLQF